MRVLSLFAGIGGFDLAFRQVGAEIVGQVEINKFCQDVLNKHFPDVPKWSDIRSVREKELPECDIITAGFPCTDVSQSGRRAGLSGEHSGLFWEVIRLLDGFTPRWIILENVPGLLSSKGGEDFQAVLDALGQFGYGVAWRVLDAQYAGTPQRRRRVFIIGSLGNTSSAKILSKPKSVPGDFTQSRSQQEGYPRDAQESDRENCLQGYELDSFTVGRGANKYIDMTPPVDCRCGNGPMQCQNGVGVVVYRMLSFNGRYINDNTAGTVKARDYKDATDLIVSKELIGVRRLTPLELERLQKFPDNWTKVYGDKTPDIHRFKAIGNAVCVSVVKQIAERIHQGD